MSRVLPSLLLSALLSQGGVEPLWSGVSILKHAVLALHDRPESCGRPGMKSFLAGVHGSELARAFYHNLSCPLSYTSNRNC